MLNDDIKATKRFYKICAIRCLIDKDYNGFMVNYSKSNYVSMDYRYSVVDEDFNDLTKLMAEQTPYYEYARRNRKPTIRDGRIKVGIVLEGFSKVQAPIQQYRTLAKYNDLFDLSYFSRIPIVAPVAVRENYSDVIEELEGLGCKVYCNDIQHFRPMEQVRFLMDSILHEAVDLLIYQTVYFIPQFNVLSHLWPAFFQCQTTHQQPEYCRHMDCVNTLKVYEPYQVVPCNQYLLSMDKKDLPKHRRAAFLIPDDAVVLVSAARPVKYDSFYWEYVESVLTRYPNTVLIPLGFDEKPPLSEDSLKRTFLVGFREDVVAFFKMADVYLDMFPDTSGALMEAAYFGVPGVTKKRPPATDSIDVATQDISSEFIPDINLDLDRLISDREYREKAGRECKQFCKQFEPREAVRRFSEALQDKFWRKARNDSM